MRRSKDRSKGQQRHVALLGPQHSRRTLRSVLDGIGAKGPYALVSAGWQEREAETGALEGHVGEPVTNLGLWPATEDAFQRDEELKRLMFARYDRMNDLARVYRVRLAAELEALRDLLGRTDPGDPDDLVGPALDPAFAALAALDGHHRARIAELDDEVFEKVRARDVVRRERERIRKHVDRAGTLLVAGGHVGILYNRMRMFGVPDDLEPTADVVGWSAGAMVLTDTIVLFHDDPPHGAGDAEVLGPGFGLAPGIVALPHAASRLHLDDRARVALAARRFAPSLVVALDDGENVRRASAGWHLDGEARVLRADGRVDARELEGAR
ncbi:MAG: hypothetical protein AAF726_12950 [Planctomycetota bacterium]